MSKVIILGNHVPRRCGIATFTDDLADSLEAAGAEVTVIAMDDKTEGYDYPGRVRCRIQEGEIGDYRKAAEYVNAVKPSALSVQHEFGIFGGVAGSHLFELLHRVEVPIITTLHTVLKEPNPDQVRVMKKLVSLSDRIVVMSQKGRQFLEDIYGVDRSAIDLIHHGIHGLDAESRKVGDRAVISTFGLLGPDKGIENVIRALPEVAAKHPAVTYRVVGATHPNLVAQHGETYRESLQELAKELGVSANVEFTDKFVTREELADVMASTDVYVTPYNKIQQIVSGTLAYAVGTGRAVISTPYWYAEELLADGRGIIVPPRDPEAIASAINRLLDNEDERLAMAAKAHEFGWQMLWPNVGKSYMSSFERAVVKPRPVMPKNSAVPEFDMRHVRAMTDDTGLIQHATFATPNRKEGYCLDDNARALQLVTDAQPHLSRIEAARLSHLYLSFMHHAYDAEAKVFRNFMSYDRRWLEDKGSEDSQGRAMWALGRTVRSGCDENVRELARNIMDDALPMLPGLTNIRSIAFAILGLVERLSDPKTNSVPIDQLRSLADKLHAALKANSSEDWYWFEQQATYCNAVLPHALLVAATYLSNPDMQDEALAALDWVARLQTNSEGQFAAVGCNGFACKDGDNAEFDQQPVEAWTSIAAYSAAYRATGDRVWIERIDKAFQWFLGANRTGAVLYDENTGGCRDGIHFDRVNQNQGAESTLSFLSSLTEWQQINKRQTNQEATIVHIS